MKSKIKFVTDLKDERIKKAITEEINEHLKDEEGHYYIHHYSMGLYYEVLVTAKYIIERDNLDVAKIIEGDTEELINKLNEEYKELPITRGTLLLKEFSKFKLYEVLKKMIYDDYEILTYYDRVLESYIEDDKKYLLMSEYPVYFINHPNVDIYCEKRSSYSLYYEELEDNIVGFTRKKYTSTSEIEYKDYDFIIYLNNSKEQVEFNKVLGTKAGQVDKLLMICNYSSITKYKRMYNSMRNILIDKDKAYLEYNKDRILLSYENKDDIKICIKELSNVKDEDLKEIINTDKEIENTIIYTTLKDIRENSYRIGFKVFNKENNIDRNKILRLIDYNEYLTKTIRNLDIEISNQIDKMIVR